MSDLPRSHHKPLDSVELRQLSHRFGSTWALREVDARFEPGALNLVVGPNGSGKSTLLSLIGTLLKPSAGQILYKPEQSPQQVRAEIGWGSQETLLYSDLSARENLTLAARLQGVNPEAAWAQAAERFGLAKFASRAVRELSRGQRQRTALARALVHSPSLLLLDEPTTGLDQEGLGRLLGVLQEEVAAQAIVIVVTHDPGLFGELPTRLLRLERGRTVGLDTAVRSR